MDIRNEALNLLAGLSNSVGAEYEDQGLALSIVEKTMEQLVKESDSLPIVSMRDLYGELRMMGLSPGNCDKIIEWSKTL